MTDKNQDQAAMIQEIKVGLINVIAMQGNAATAMELFAMAAAHGDHQMMQLVLDRREAFGFTDEEMDTMTQSAQLIKSLMGLIDSMDAEQTEESAPADIEAQAKAATDALLARHGMLH